MGFGIFVGLGAQSLPVRQQWTTAILGLGCLIVIVYLVRQRKLREEFAWMWLFTGGIIFVLSIWYDLLLFITHFIGAVLPTSALFFFGLLFLVGICLHLSLKVSLLSNEVKNLTQSLTLLQSDLEHRQSNPSVSSPRKP